jgi:hypothetical protein
VRRFSCSGHDCHQPSSQHRLLCGSAGWHWRLSDSSGSPAQPALSVAWDATAGTRDDVDLHSGPYGSAAKPNPADADLIGLWNGVQAYQTWSSRQQPVPDPSPSHNPPGLWAQLVFEPRGHSYDSRPNHS